MSEVDSTIQTIRLYEKDIDATKHKIDTINEQLRDELEAMQEYIAVRDAQEVLDEAKAKLKLALLDDASYNNLLEEKGQLNEKMRDMKEILSDHLVAYFAQTNERQIEISDNGDARSVIITGKLGKRQKYQTSLLAGDMPMTS